jgi:hypothetical protein
VFLYSSSSQNTQGVIYSITQIYLSEAAQNPCCKGVSLSNQYIFLLFYVIYIFFILHIADQNENGNHPKSQRRDKQQRGKSLKKILQILKIWLYNC